MALEIHEESVGDIRVLGLSGRLDTDTAADLELAVQDLIDAGAKEFVIDLSGVGYVSSAGLRVLLMLGKSIDGKGSLRLCGLNPTVRQVFDVAGFTQLFVITANRESALQGNKPKPAAIGAKPAESDTLTQAVARLLGVKSPKSASAKADPVLATDVLRLLALR